MIFALWSTSKYVKERSYSDSAALISESAHSGNVDQNGFYVINF